jgi:hypothetical protein
MPNSFLHLQIECDRAAREFLALAAWGFNKNAVRQAVNTMTSSSSASASARAWLDEHTNKLPMNEEPRRLLQDLVQADAALRAYKATPEAAQALAECDFAGRLRRD